MHCWERFEKQGKEWFVYMSSHFDTMITDSHINHFDIGIGIRSLDADVIKESHIYDIEQSLISWIYAEYQSGDLFNQDLWKPFSDPEAITSMFLGYRKMFTFVSPRSPQTYYFQLALKDECEDYTLCHDCNNKNVKNIHFILAYYGWKEQNNPILQPYDIYSDLHEGMLPDKYWV